MAFLRRPLAFLRRPLAFLRQPLAFLRQPPGISTSSMFDGSSFGTIPHLLLVLHCLLPFPMAADAVVQMEYFMVAKYQHWGTTRGREWLVLAQFGDVGFFRETRQLGSLCPKDYLFSEYCVFFSHLFFSVYVSQPFSARLIHNV